jgi:hypothetical protein
MILQFGMESIQALNNEYNHFSAVSVHHLSEIQMTTEMLFFIICRSPNRLRNIMLLQWSECHKRNYATMNLNMKSHNDNGMTQKVWP